MFLTLGIAMGSYWAYYELGWGGWWFWDPVENASFMPWLAGTALLHSAVVMEKRDALKVWTILLAILDLLAVAARHLPGALRRADLGACLRHRSDARRLHPCDPDLSSSAARSRSLPGARRRCKQGGLFAPISREGALVLNNLFLTAACATVFVGTLYPLALEALTGDKISVGAPFFNVTFGAADRAAADCDAVRAVAGLEARRSLRRRRSGCLARIAVAAIGDGRDIRRERRRPFLRRSRSGWRCSSWPAPLTDLVERI